MAAYYSGVDTQDAFLHFCSQQAPLRVDIPFSGYAMSKKIFVHFITCLHSWFSQLVNSINASTKYGYSPYDFLINKMRDVKNVSIKKTCIYVSIVNSYYQPLKSAKIYNLLTLCAFYKCKITNYNFYVFYKSLKTWTFLACCVISFPFFKHPPKKKISFNIQTNKPIQHSKHNEISAHQFFANLSFAVLAFPSLQTQIYIFPCS